jgi:hypothetical protein
LISIKVTCYETLITDHASYLLRLEVLMAMEMSMLAFWDVTPSKLVGRYQGFGGTYCLHLQD